MMSIKTIAHNFLQTDQQTLSDLSIFGKNSVYDLYNYTATRGGADLLFQFFQEPLSNKRSIEERVNIFRFFSSSKYDFPVDGLVVEMVANYLRNNDPRTRLDQQHGNFSGLLKSLVSKDPDQIMIREGVRNCVRLFNSISRFLENTNAGGSAYEREYRQLVSIINDSGFEQLGGYVDFNVKLSLSEVSTLDQLFRFDKRHLLLELLDMLFRLDVYISIAELAKKNGWTYPEIGNDGDTQLIFHSLYHPAVTNAIPNDVMLEGNENVLLLTGANMAGKSTLMKALGISLYLAHMGFPVAADRLQFPVMDGLFTTINLSDNMVAGQSHFYSEVLRVKEIAILLNEGKKLFVIFDELFRGTNVKDAYEGTLEVLRALSKKLESKFIVSTHIMEAGEILRQENENISFQYLATEMNGNMPVYTRKLKYGITADRQGMTIINNEGILDILSQTKSAI